MGSSRDNHYVAQWYQAGFLEPGKSEIACLDLSPSREILHDGRVITQRNRYRSPLSRSFMQRDLYSTFLGTASGTAVDDEIERKLFGEIDRKGAQAIRAFQHADVDGWMQHFETLFEFLNIQKLRTPKGLDWLRTQYPPPLVQNELMREMQGLRLMHVSLWSQCVREIVSARNSDEKFIISDHPVTIYNSALPPSNAQCEYPHDPSIALKGTQTLFPLDRDHLLILTNLEYARDPLTNPLEKRTFARSYRTTLSRSDALIRKRELSTEQIRAINQVISARARRYLAGGTQDWLRPASPSANDWKAIAPILAPPKDELWKFGGQILVKMRDGRVHYQDEYGRQEPEHQQLLQITPVEPKSREACGCGSGRTFRDCCSRTPSHLRPSWGEISIRERNLGLLNAAVTIFGLNQTTDWTRVRREMTDEKIRQFYEVYASLWPLETDILSLLPKPDGRPRAVYTGILHPEAVFDFAVGAGLYFGEILIENPLPHPRTIRAEHSPLHQPAAYRGEILKALIFLLEIAPLVQVGVVNLVPDPCSFDVHLREQLHQMARERNDGRSHVPPPTGRMRQLAEDDARRAMMMVMPERALLSDMKRAAKELGSAVQTSRELRQSLDYLKRNDPLAVLQAEPLPKGEAGGQFTMMRLSPNFEMVMYLAQATGACVVTDSPERWRELLDALARRGGVPNEGLPNLVRVIAEAPFAFVQHPHDVAALHLDGTFAPYASTFGDITAYLHKLETMSRRPNYEAHLVARFRRAEAVQKKPSISGVHVRQGRMLAAMPTPGIRDNTVNRLLLMSSSEHHWMSVPMAVLIRPVDGIAR